MLVGIQLSIPGGMHLAVHDGVRLGLDCVQVFTKNQRQWKWKPLHEDEIKSFRSTVHDSGGSPFERYTPSPSASSSSPARTHPSHGWNRGSNPLGVIGMVKLPAL